MSRLFLPFEAGLTALGDDYYNHRASALCFYIVVLQAFLSSALMGIFPLYFNIPA